jgi:hypothetical protein
MVKQLLQRLADIELVCFLLLKLLLIEIFLTLDGLLGLLASTLTQMPAKARYCS